VRCAVVAPVPVPYREPLFAALARRGTLELRVIYQAAAGAGWDQARAWFPEPHAYDAVQLGAVQRRRAGRTPVMWPRGLERALTAFDPAVVVAWEYGPAALRAWAWCRRHRRPCVIFSECTPWIDALLPAAQLRVHRWLARRAQGHIAASGAARRRFVALGADPQTVQVSLQAFDAGPLRAAAAARDPREPGPIRLLTVARLVADKNLDALIEAVAGLAPGEAELRLVGSGPLEGSLRALAARRQAPVDFAGELPRAEVPAAFAAADAFVLPSRFEPFGVVVREAAAAGLPIVCSERAGAAGDVAVAGRNALLVDPDDRSALQAAVARIVREPELRTRLGRESAAIDGEQPLARSVEAFERAVLQAHHQRACASSTSPARARVT
jgi:glycosyltransferase involved in cell wall biosynthesis